MSALQGDLSLCFLNRAQDAPEIGCWNKIYTAGTFYVSSVDIPPIPK